MSVERRHALIARICLTAGALLPYWRIVTFSVVLATDDYITSDNFSGELPGRVLVGAALRAGHLPLWTNAFCSGYPLAGAPADPIGLALFTLLPPAAALDGMLLVIILVAAHGTYALARRFGADRPSAVLAGIAFADSGYMATQLKHLSIMSTVMWLPVGLLLIDRLFTTRRRRRPVVLALLGLLYANQVLAGFPQSAYICALLYGTFMLFRLVQERRRFAGAREPLALVAGFAAAFALGAAAGAVVLLPLAEFTTMTDRVAPLNYLWATYTNFWPPNILTFFVPYLNGDSTNATYIGDTPFWENYGYVGVATALLAIYGVARERRRPVTLFLAAMTALAFSFVLGPHTPIFHVAFVLVPGMDHFRGPTRFMVVVDLGLALLGAIGLARLRADLQGRMRGSRVPLLVAAGVCVFTAADLFVHQTRQNAFVPAREWLAPPATVAMIRADSPAPRTYSPHHRMFHRLLSDRNHGWTNIEPFDRFRALLSPDTGGAYWDVPSADGYVGIAPRWYVATWGYQYDENAVVLRAAYPGFGGRRVVADPNFATLLRTYGVTHVLTPLPLDGTGITPIGRDGDVYVYRVESSARVRVVPVASVMPTQTHALVRLRDPAFDPAREVLLHDVPASIGTPAREFGVKVDGTPGSATILADAGDSLTVDADAPQDGFLVLADMYFPGWTATVDGVGTPIYRANIGVRAIALAKGHHTVRFVYQSAPFWRGLTITAAALAALIVWLVVASYRAQRAPDGLVEADELT
jgi:hypothetical protein